MNTIFIVLMELTFIAAAIFALLEHHGGLMSCIFIFIVSAFGYAATDQSVIDARAAAEKQDIADRTPRLIAEKDGCKVYAFKQERWHYFTKCSDRTTTDTTIVERHGKSTTTRTESIVTENQK